jgi:hypothetical protein
MKLTGERVRNQGLKHLFLFAGIAAVVSINLLSGDLWTLCDRELHSYYVPIETRRGFNAMESRGYVFRLRLVVEMIPESNVLDITGAVSEGEHRVELSALKRSLKECLTRAPSKGLIAKAIEEHGPGREPSEVLKKAFNKGLHQCLDSQVPESFELSLGLFCDRKITDWR